MGNAVEIKHLVIAVFFVFWACAYPAMSRTLHESSAVRTQYQQWMLKYGRFYVDDVEKENRFQIFKENLEYIEKSSSAGNKSYELGLNQFADLTYEEFIASYTGLKQPSPLLYPSKKAPVASIFNQSDIPATIDWRQNGAVTSVKNQGPNCECCWAFATVAALEGILKIKTGNLVALSVQQLVDCDQGCDPGVIARAFNYILENNGLATQNDYPYKGTVGPCAISGKKLMGQISSFTTMPALESDLLQVVARQPVSVGIAISNDFRLYKSGVFTGPCGDSLNHAVTVVGYGSDPFYHWLLKNSWGDSWGENGYMKLKRGSGSPWGLCGIAKLASYPTIN